MQRMLLRLQSRKDYNMKRTHIIAEIQNKKSYLCIGLDTDAAMLPECLQDHPNKIFEFNKRIIDATHDLCVSYKINTAFYEALGSKGWEAMEETVNYIPSTHFKIADAKRGDIGNTSSQYARAFFETLAFDAITVAPYMGEDSIRPFLEYENKWTIVLALTSNKGAADFELQKNGDQFLYERVIEKVCTWGNADNLMFVTGATQSEKLVAIRKQIPDHFLLVPGVGFQGGSLAEVSKVALNKDAGLLVNVSRAILYASAEENFAEQARETALQYQAEMKTYIL